MAAPQGDGRRRPRRLEDVWGDGDGVDRISYLPEELLLQVLARLRCARQAARTSVLARRWRGLWTRLPEYTFFGLEPESVEAALAQVTRPSLDRLEFSAGFNSEAALRRATSLLLAAAELQPEELSVSMWTCVRGARAVELPCFDRTVSFDLVLDGIIATPPPAGEFTRLESLELTFGEEEQEILGALLPRCPRLRVLQVYYGSVEALTIHSAALQKLEIYASALLSPYRRHVDIDAPLLKEAMLRVEMDLDDEHLTVSLSAPIVEKLDWVISDELLGALRYTVVHGVRTLLLWDFSPARGQRFAQKIKKLPVTDFSVLSVEMQTLVHAFAPSVLRFLRIQPRITTLRLHFDKDKEDYEEDCCPQNCPCRQPTNWRSEHIPLTDLEEVAISCALKVGGEEIDFLKLLFRCAPRLKRVKVEVPRNGFETEIKKICRICRENPLVECCVCTIFFSSLCNT